jgi:N-glycosylase/DNA lyase
MYVLLLLLSQKENNMAKLRADTRHKTEQRQPMRRGALFALLVLDRSLVTTVSRPTTSAFTMAGNNRNTRQSSRLTTPQKIVAVTPEPVLSSAPQTPTKRRRSPIPLASLSTPVSGSPSESLAVVKSLTCQDIAKIAPERDFQDLGVAPAELRPSATLTTGQCFHWRVVDTRMNSSTIDNNGDDVKKEPVSAWGSHDATEWIGTLRVSLSESVVLAIKETPDTTLYKILQGPDGFDFDSFLWRYFQLDEKIVPLYQEWSNSCPRLSKIADCIPGVRIIDQDPWECLVSFLCSSNNNIPRITKMLTALRREYGEALLTVGDETFYSFPSLETLKHATDDDLRQKCGLGYRAKYLLETMKILESLGGEQYLQELRSIQDPVEVQAKLVQFCGVGNKVADCVALFSLKQDKAIPVDVHVWNIARRDYDTERQLESVKSLTPVVYRQVGDLFRAKFDSKCGWAHSLLFVAELPSFRTTLPTELIQEMEKVCAKYSVASVCVFAS